MTQTPMLTTAARRGRCRAVAGRTIPDTFPGAFENQALVAAVPSGHVMTNQFTSGDSASTQVQRRDGLGAPLRNWPAAHPERAALRKELSRACRFSTERSTRNTPSARRLSMPIFLLCGLRGFPAAIPGQFSSSLSSSFARGRRTTAFLQAANARPGARSPGRCSGQRAGRSS